MSGIDIDIEKLQVERDRYAAQAECMSIRVGVLERELRAVVAKREEIREEVLSDIELRLSALALRIDMLDRRLES